MNTTQRRLLFGTILFFGALWILPGLSKSRVEGAQINAAPQEGFSAPDFSLQTIEGETVTLSDFRGKVVVLNFWATWCPPCREEMPALESVYETYREDGFVVLAVNLTVQDAGADVQRFAEDEALTFPILLDENGAIAKNYRVQSLPTSFFIGKDGVIRKIVIGGPMSQALLSTRIESLLEEMP